MWDGTVRNVKPQRRGEEMKPVSDGGNASLAVTIVFLPFFKEQLEII